MDSACRTCLPRVSSCNHVAYACGCDLVISSPYLLTGSRTMQLGEYQDVLVCMDRNFFENDARGKTIKLKNKGSLSRREVKLPRLASEAARMKLEGKRGDAKSREGVGPSPKLSGLGVVLPQRQASL